jgi:hypothetical protein
MHKSPFEFALQRVQDLFECEVGDPSKTTFSDVADRSKVAENAFDDMLFDLQDIGKIMGTQLEVNTVGEWCAVVDRYARTLPQKYNALVREWRVDRVEKWKRARRKPKQGFAGLMEKLLSPFCC